MSGAVLSAGAGRPRPPRCLVCDRHLADSELATCRDVHAACPSRPEVTFLQKVRHAAPVAGWPDDRCPTDLVCPRCAALVNDIVIYESRLADMTQQLVAMVTTTTLDRAAAAEAAAPAAADKPKPRRPRKAPPKRNKPAESGSTPPEPETAAVERERRRRSCTPTADCFADQDEDDPTPFADDTGSELILGVSTSNPPTPSKECTWLVTAYPAVRRSGVSRARRRPAGPHICSFCDKQLASASSLQKHLQLHTNERRFQCAACDKAFFDSRALRRHEVDHTGVRPFCCATCGKMLLSSHALRIHQRNHLGIKPAECDVCHKKMSSAQMLREHMRIHTGERPFSCEVCGRTFRTERILTSHQRTHTGVRPHVCDVCGRTFSQRTPLTAHLRSHSAAQLASVRRERIGHTAVRTAAGIFDAKDGHTVRPLAAPPEGGRKASRPQPVAVPAAVPPAAAGTDVGGPGDVGLTLASLMPVCADGGGGDGAGCGGGGDGGMVGLQPGQTPVPDGMGTL